MHTLCNKKEKLFFSANEFIFGDPARNVDQVIDVTKRSAQDEGLNPVWIGRPIGSFGICHVVRFELLDV